MDFPDSYFEDEVREGFYVPSLMKRAWAAQWEVFEEFRQVCEKHHIRYFAEWGTLLGVIRHGGRIPWDDDLDVCMLREDYDKFREVACEELPENCLFWDNLSEAGFDGTVGRLINSRVHVLEGETLAHYHGFPYVAGMDIFLLDYIPQDRKGEEQLHQNIEILYMMIEKIKQDERQQRLPDSEELSWYLDKLEAHMKGAKDFLTKGNRKRPLKQQLYDWIDKLCSEVDKDRAREVSNIPVWIISQRYRLPKKCFQESIPFPFENTEIAVPIGYDELLQKKYGRDWMQPVRSGGSHEYPSYAKQEQYLREENAAQLFEYKFSRKELEASRLPKETLQNRIKGFLPLLCEAHEEIVRAAGAGNYGTAQQILGDCQNMAIQLGTVIEEELGEGHETVRLLERYCELVFHLYQQVSQERTSNAAELSDLLASHLTVFEGDIAESVAHDWKNRREVVFVPYKASYWKAMESVWQTAVEEKETDVYVIPAPYYYKDAFGRVKSEEPHYETAYPDYVTITPYEEYNFEVHHPDQIVIQCPYDEYNYGFTIHPFFYAKNLKKYTDKLVYIPALVMDEIGAEDDRARETLKSYCNMPGVVCADAVFVQSEQMKKVYVDLLSEFAGEETRQIWENKIFGKGSPVYDWGVEGKEEQKLPEEWLQMIRKPDGGWKKIVLYDTSVGALWRYGQRMLHKMQSVFQTFWENQDEVVLLWRPDPKVEQIGKEHPDLWRDYQALRDRYIQEGWGICDVSTDADRAVRICDACYGDGGSIMNACKVWGKPVMLQRL